MKIPYTIFKKLFNEPNIYMNYCYNCHGYIDYTRKTYDYIWYEYSCNCRPRYHGRCIPKKCMMCHKKPEYIIKYVNSIDSDGDVVFHHKYICDITHIFVK